MNWLLVACGGAIGASLRYGAGFLISQPQSLFPWITWSINVLGCLLAGIFFAFTLKYPVLDNEVRLLFMVGILGGFTTFSSFGLETFQFIRQEQMMMALLYAVSSTLIGLLVLALGYYLTHFFISIE